MSKLDLDPETIDKMQNYMNKMKNMLVYHGSPGIGKTFFCSALIDWAFQNFSTRRYHTEESILRKLRASISEGHGDYLIALEYLCDDDIVMLDDVGSGINVGKFTNRDLEFRREVFFSFLDYRYRIQKPTIITSNFSKKDIDEVYSERIYSRLFASENTIISIFDPSQDKRKQGM